MKPGDRVTWHTYKRDAEHNFITFDAVILAVGEGWSRVEIEYLDRRCLFAQRHTRVVPGDRLIWRRHYVPELDGDILSGTEDSS